MDFEDEARRVVADLYLPGPTHYFDAAERTVAAALRGAASDGAREIVDWLDGNMALADGARSSLSAAVDRDDVDFVTVTIVAAAVRAMRKRLATSAPKPDAGERCRSIGAAITTISVGEQPKPPASPNPVSQPTAQSNGEGDVLGRPVTYWAGTVPAKIVAGMVLRSLGGRTATVVSHGPKWASLIDDEDGREYVVPVARLADCWTLARDFTEPGGGES
jgi:hypothetical protein